MNKKDNTSQEIPGMELNHNYSNKKPIIPEEAKKMQKEMDKKKKELDKLKNFITRKYNFVQAIGILPPQSTKEFIEEEIGENIPSQELEKLQNKKHVYIIVPEEKFKEISKIKTDIVRYIEKESLNVWIYIKTPVDIWETCFDSKFEMVDAIAMSYPIYDKGLLSGLRVASIHKSLVLQKFDKYVVSYVVAGSLVREEAVKTSDVDAFVIINDTDVKRMPRLELKERLRAMISQYISEASSLAGVKDNFLSVQVYLLTEFWESVKDANPVMFTFIRDGVPIYDKGTFMPWKALLKMGKLKPSPESIDMFMSMGDSTIKRAKRSLLDIAISDIYWGVATPSQALLMLNGSPPPAPKHLISEMEKIFVEKEKLLTKKDINILKEIVKLYKDYEHDKVKEIKGSKIDKLILGTEEYLKKLKELREQIEKRYQERTIEQIYKDLIDLLKTITSKKSQSDILIEFEKYVKKGKFTKQDLRAINKVIKARNDFKKGKADSKKIDSARKDARILINDLIDYSQRCELANSEKSKIKLKYKNKNNKETYAELVFAGDKLFVLYKNSVKKIEKKSLINSNMNELSQSIEKSKKNSNCILKLEILEILKKELGNFEIVL